MSRATSYAIFIFAGFSLAAGAMIVAANTLSDPLSRSVLIQMGSVIFGAGLTVMLLRLLGEPTLTQGKQ